MESPIDIAFNLISIRMHQNLLLGKNILQNCLDAGKKSQLWALGVFGKINCFSNG